MWDYLFNHFFRPVPLVGRVTDALYAAELELLRASHDRERAVAAEEAVQQRVRRLTDHLNSLKDQ